MSIDTDRLIEVAREELACLWRDLEDARGSAISGQWSIRCDNLVDRMKDLTLLVGPTPWDELPITILESGIYQRIHAAWGIDGPDVQPDMARVAEVRARLDAQLAAIRAGR